MSDIVLKIVEKNIVIFIIEAMVFCKFFYYLTSFLQIELAKLARKYYLSCTYFTSLPLSPTQPTTDGLHQMMDLGPFRLCQMMKVQFLPKFKSSGGLGTVTIKVTLSWPYTH